jgi:hypothetical protein
MPETEGLEAIALEWALSRLEGRVYSISDDAGWLS